MATNLPHAKKELGQHWLEDQASLKAMVSAAQVSEGEVVLEIGPGTGTLTDELIHAGAKVVALEYDQQRYRQLVKKYQSSHDKVSIHEGDIRTYDLTTLPELYKIVANIPYYLTANLLRKIVDDEHKPTVAALLVQKEVAERVAARPGDLSQIAIFVQVFYRVTLDEIVPAHLFTPPPKVDSQVLILAKREVPLFGVDDRFFMAVKAGFSERRKKLRSSVASGLQLSKPEAEDLLKKAGINPDLRAQELQLTDWQKLASQLPLP